MAPRRLVPATDVARWEAELRAAALAAWDEMRRDLDRSLASRGVHTLVAAGQKPARQHPIAAPTAVWSAAAWAAAVDKHIKPVAQKVAKEAAAVAGTAVAAGLVWGAASSAGKAAQAVVDRALKAGKAIGDRLGIHLGRAAASEAPDVVNTVLATAPAILEDSIGSAATMVTESATYDVTSYVAGYTSGTAYTDATRTWNAIGDDRTREDHQDADGQEVGLNDVFIVGGEEMTGPGDPSASPEQVEGCRCWTTTSGLDPAEDIYGEDLEGET